MEDEYENIVKNIIWRTIRSWDIENTAVKFVYKQKQTGELE